MIKNYAQTSFWNPDEQTAKLKECRPESQSFPPPKLNPNRTNHHNSLKIALLMHKNSWKWLC
ncbi:hypothetical protein BYT27DRAFT_6787674 [Phlegmacium glaucopus]|nr:hypothetical protein BYT27DRAFT_6787674 [Phlegmacium glaucopus]